MSITYAESVARDLECAAAARALWPDRHFTVWPGRMTDAGYSWPVAVPAPEGWAPRGYHVTTCGRCGEVTERYSAHDARIVHRATGWAMCARDVNSLPSALRGLADKIEILNEEEDR